MYQRLSKISFKKELLKVIKMTKGAPHREYIARLGNKSIGSLYVHGPRSMTPKKVISSEIKSKFRKKGHGYSMYKEVLKQEGALVPDVGRQTPGAQAI